MSADEMTNPNETLPVEQVDRDAAANTACHFADYSHHWLREIRNGLRDESVIVQAFARHRRAAQSPPPVSEGAEHDLLELLSVIHRDGGHYVEQHGMEKAVADAVQLSVERLSSPPPGCDAETIEACAKVCEQQMQDFLSPEYATGQPLSSVQERIACKMCAERIRNLGKEQG